jgi:hypothetical protein
LQAYLAWSRPMPKAKPTVHPAPSLTLPKDFSRNMKLLAKRIVTESSERVADGSGRIEANRAKLAVKRAERIMTEAVRERKLECYKTWLELYGEYTLENIENTTHTYLNHRDNNPAPLFKFHFEDLNYVQPVCEQVFLPPHLKFQNIIRPCMSRSEIKRLFVIWSKQCLDIKNNFCRSQIELLEK